jgi:hypothetical protein
MKYAHVFHDEELNDFQATNVVEYEIPVGDTPPIRRPPYRTLYALRDEIRTQVEKNATTRSNKSERLSLVSARHFAF